MSIGPERRALVRNRPDFGPLVQFYGLARRLRWLLLLLTVPALRGTPRIQVGPRGRWMVSNGASVRIGAGASVGANHFVSVEAALTIGESFYANRDLYLCAMAGVLIGDRVRFGERVSIHDENHAFEPVGSRLVTERDGYIVAPIEIGDGVWLGANCVILGGARIGADTVVAANSVVTGDLPAGVLAGGAPARVLRDLRRDEG